MEHAEEQCRKQDGFRSAVAFIDGTLYEAPEKRLLHDRCQDDRHQNGPAARTYILVELFEIFVRKKFEQRFNNHTGNENEHDSPQNEGSAYPSRMHVQHIGRCLTRPPLYKNESYRKPHLQEVGQSIHQPRIPLGQPRQRPAYETRRERRHQNDAYHGQNVNAVGIDTTLHLLRLRPVRGPATAFVAAPGPVCSGTIGGHTGTVLPSLLSFVRLVHLLHIFRPAGILHNDDYESPILQRLS